MDLTWFFHKALIIAQREKSFSEIHKATRGIIFLGTPHRGSDASLLGLCIATIAAPFFGSNKMLLKTLRFHDDDLVDKQKEFSQSCPGGSVYQCCIFETLQTHLFGIPIGLVCNPFQILSIAPKFLLGCQQIICNPRLLPFIWGCQRSFRVKQIQQPRRRLL